MENKRTKLQSASEVNDWMYFYLGEWCATEKFEKIGVSSKDVFEKIWQRIPRWSQDYMDDQEYFAEDMSVGYYLYSRLIGLGWKIQYNQETQNLAKVKRISFEEAKQIMKIPSGPTVFLDFHSTRIPAESEEDLQRFTDMCDFVIEEEFMKKEKISDRLKEISYEEAVKIFEDPNGPTIYLLFDDGTEIIAETKEELKLHYAHGLKFSIKNS